MDTGPRRSIVTSAVLSAGLWATVAGAATLPEHEPIDVLIVSDGVNPHGLAPDQLTEPGDLEAAFAASDSGISTGLVEEVASACVDEALAWLESDEPPDVLVYFAHQAATLCGGGSGQAELVTSTEAHLAAGRGVLVFHHGLYVASGKDAMLELLGMESDAIAWDTSEGQDVVSVASEHFVSTHGIDYDLTRGLPELPGVSAGDYPAFNNTPDERYPITTLLTSADETRTVLFATASGTPRILGYDLQPPGLPGHVIAYQPGEHQPTVLDDRDGPNFQILANALVYLSGQAPTGGPPAGTGGTGNVGGSPNDGGSPSGGGSPSDGGSPGDGGSPSDGGSEPGAGGQAATGGSSTGSGGTPSDGGSGSTDGDAGGCVVRPGSSGGDRGLGWLALGGLGAFLVLRGRGLRARTLAGARGGRSGAR